jgi:FAD synthetase
VSRSPHDESHLIFVIGTVLLHLYVGALARRLSPSEALMPIKGVYIPIPSPFPTLETFIDDSVKSYDLELLRCNPPGPSINGSATLYTNADRPVRADGGEGIKQALYMYKKKFPQITAILIGTRRNDPHGSEYPVVSVRVGIFTSPYYL